MSRRSLENNDYLTTNQGVLISNDESSLTVGERGPVVLTDVQLIEKLASFNRERIPERVVHAKGAGAYGYFKLYNSMKKYTKAKFLNGPNKETPVFVRFSTVIGSKGSADTLRDPRGFAVKFYTEEGNYDLVGNHLPVFFIRDAIKFPDLIHAFKPSPDTNIPDANRFWDFVTNTPESIHMITFLFSDRGTIKSFRTIEGFGVNTYVWVSEEGKRVYVKYHWKPLSGLRTIDRHEAEKLAGIDPDVAVRDLYDTLNKGKNVEYELFVQIMDVKDEFSYDFDPLDATKTWPEDLLPLMKVGKLTLTDAPKNFFAEVEQAAFCPANLVPGIEASYDKLLQGRLFAYHDSQRHRIGSNFEELPINRPKVPVNNINQDGSMEYCYRDGKVNYKPNSLNDNRPIEYKEKEICPIYVEGKVERKKIKLTNDFNQAGNLYMSYSKEEKEHLIDNLAYDLRNVDRKIQSKAIELFRKCNKEYGENVKCKLQEYNK
ncbi:catalase [Clostridium ihumii]|uniref:catalase n=1 Tax=Clostridium ihumii TaxID=1470356 RepID=UPI0005901757|nr:catalase [Clostridium ihumii]